MTLSHGTNSVGFPHPWSMKIPAASGNGSACVKTRSVTWPIRSRMDPATTLRFSSWEKWRKCIALPGGWGAWWPGVSVGRVGFFGRLTIRPLLLQERREQCRDAEHGGHQDDERDDRAVGDVLPARVHVLAHVPLVVEQEQQEEQARRQQRHRDHL